MALDRLNSRAFWPALIADGLRDTPWVSGVVSFIPERGIAVEIPYLDERLTAKTSDGSQFEHVRRWFDDGEGGLPANLHLQVQEGEITLFNCRTTTRQWQPMRGTAFAQISAEHAVLASRSGPLGDELLVTELRSRIDGLDQWALITAIRERVQTDEQTKLIESLDITLKSASAIRWQQGGATMTIESDWGVSGPRDARALRNDVLFVSRFEHPRSVSDHLSEQRKLLTLLSIAFGEPIGFREHAVRDTRFSQQVGPRTHTPWRQLLTRATVTENNAPKLPQDAYQQPLLTFGRLGTEGLERWSSNWVRWQRVTLPLASRLRRRGDLIEDRVVSASMSVEAAAHLIGRLPTEELTYGRGRPTTTTHVFRVLADLGVVMARASRGTRALARALAGNYNDIKHYDRGAFPDAIHSYLSSRVLMAIARLWTAREVLATEEERWEFMRSPEVLTLLQEIEDGFVREGVAISAESGFCDVRGDLEV